MDYISFADTATQRAKIIEVIMRDGRTSNSHALDVVARLYEAGFKIIETDKLSTIIQRHGEIPHMTIKP